MAFLIRRFLNREGLRLDMLGFRLCGRVDLRGQLSFLGGRFHGKVEGGQMTHVVFPRSLTERYTDSWSKSKRGGYRRELSRIIVAEYSRQSPKAVFIGL
jgi:hypothetical protein